VTEDPVERRWRGWLQANLAGVAPFLSIDAALGLLHAARQVRDKAYAPYSKFRVGAAILGRNGRLYTGVNVENASYGATICAERAAVVGAIGDGCGDFAAVAVVADFPRPTPPCGICRQVLAEFTSTAPVFMANMAGEIEVRSLAELLPLAFELKP